MLAIFLCRLVNSVLPQRAHPQSSIRGFLFNISSLLDIPRVLSLRMCKFAALFFSSLFTLQTFSRDGRRKARTRLRTCQPCESYQMDHRLIRSSYLVCQQDVALSTCLLQVWQYRPLCWSVIIGEKEHGALCGMLMCNRGLLLVRAPLLQLLVQPCDMPS